MIFFSSSQYFEEQTCFTSLKCFAEIIVTQVSVLLWRGFTLTESAKFAKLNQPDYFPCLIFIFCTGGKTWNGKLANTFYRVELKYTKLNYNHENVDVEVESWLTDTQDKALPFVKFPSTFELELSISILKINCPNLVLLFVYIHHDDC